MKYKICNIPINAIKCDVIFAAKGSLTPNSSSRLHLCVKQCSPWQWISSLLRPLF